MNNARRKTITDLITKANEIESLANDLAQQIADLQAEEQDSFDNLTEGLQATERGQASEAAADALQEAVSAIEEAASAAIETISNLETASE